MNNEINQSRRFEEKINSINSSFLSALDNFNKYFVYYHTNPDVDDYSDNFLNTKNQLQGLSSNMFTTTNNIEKSIEEMDNHMSEISVKLTKEKKKNKELEKMLNSLKGTEKGSDLLISDSKIEYNLVYFKNIELFIGILIILALLVSSKVAFVLLVVALIFSYYLGILKMILPVVQHI
jgi:hypothetical protein